MMGGELSQALRGVQRHDDRDMHGADMENRLGCTQHAVKIGPSEDAV